MVLMRALRVGVVSLAIVLGCEATAPQRPPPVFATPAVAKLAVGLDIPDVRIQNPNCENAKRQVQKSVHEALLKEFDFAHVDANAARKPDLFARSFVVLEDCSDGVAGSATLRLEAGGRVIASTTARPHSQWGEGVSSGAEWGPDVAPYLVRTVLNSPELEKFATSGRSQDKKPDNETTGAERDERKSSGGADKALVTGSPQRNAHALIIGISKYREVVEASGARADAERFARIARTTLGIPEAQIRVALDERAAHSDMEKHLSWLKSNVRAGGRIYFYFSGHGAPEPSSGTSYLLPYDGDPKSLDATALRLGDVLKRLSETGAKDVVAFVDACFSGAGGRSVLPKGARPLVRVKEEQGAGRVALLSAASGAEISGSTPDNSSGLFSSILAEGLGRGQADADANGEITLQELVSFVKPRVERIARQDSREQTPHLTTGNDVRADEIVVASGLPAK